MASTARQVVFGERLELKWPGSRLSSSCKAIVLGDIDNDGTNELMIGSLGGDLAVFKLQQARPYLCCRGLGTIGCLAVGDVFNIGQNVLVAVNAEGFCHIIAAPSDTVPFLTPACSFEIPRNCSAILIADIDLDGCNELVVGNHDRLVCAYSLQCRSDAVDVLRTSGKVLHAEQYHLHQRGRWRMNEQVVSLCLTYSLEPASANPVPAAAAAAATSPTSPTSPTNPATPQQQPPSNESATRSPASPPRSPTAPSGTPSTPTSPAEALTPSAPRTPTSQSSPSPPAATATAPKPLIVVGLQGASYAVISFTEGVLTEANGGLSPPSVPTTRTSKHGVLTEVAGPIWRLAADAASPRPRSSHPRSRSGKSAGSSPAAAAGAAAAAAPTSHADLSTVIPISALASRASPSDADDEAAPEPRGTPLVAIATLDGMLTLQQQQDSSSSVLWTQQVLHQLFAVFPFGYERELIAACAWNGMTYIIDQQRNMVRFRFPERVCTFYAGEYAVHAGGANEPCLVYVTFNDRIFVYYNLGLDRIGASNLLEAMQDDFQHYRVLKENQESLEWTFQEQASLIHSCLYHPMNTVEQQAYQTTLQERLSQIMEENKQLEEELLARRQLAMNLS